MTAVCCIGDLLGALADFTKAGSFVTYALVGAHLQAE